MDGGVYSPSAWRRLTRLLQFDYSRALYRAAGLVDGEALNLIWLPLLSDAAMRLLTQMGVCWWEPRLPDHPLHAPHSLSSPRDCVWRHTTERAVPSHGWVEVTHTNLFPWHPERKSDKLPWLYVARGSGISLNVGRTAVLSSATVRSCPRGARSREQLSCLGRGLDLKQFDSLQLLSSYDFGDSSVDSGFRHELVLLSTALLREGQDLDAAVLGSPRRDGGDTAILCGRWPQLFNCSAEHPALRFMRHNAAWSPWHQSGHGAVTSLCLNTSWGRLLRDCGQGLRRPTCTSSGLKLRGIIEGELKSPQVHSSRS